MATTLTSLNAKVGDLDLVSATPRLTFGGVNKNISFSVVPLGVTSASINSGALQVLPADDGSLTFQSTAGTIAFDGATTPGSIVFSVKGTDDGGTLILDQQDAIPFSEAGVGEARPNSPPPLPAENDPAPDPIYTYMTADWALRPSYDPTLDLGIYYDLTGTATNFTNTGIASVSGISVNLSMVVDNPDLTVEPRPYINVANSFQQVPFNNGYNAGGTLGKSMMNHSGLLVITPEMATALNLEAGGQLRITALAGVSAYTGDGTALAGSIELVCLAGQLYQLANDGSFGATLPA